MISVWICPYLLLFMSFDGGKMEVIMTIWILKKPYFLRLFQRLFLWKDKISITLFISFVSLLDTALDSFELAYSKIAAAELI